MKEDNLSQYIDQTLLKPEASLSDIKKIVDEAKQYQFKTVCINPCYVKFAAEQLKSTNVKVCTVVGFPLGANTTTTKVFETKQSINDGAKEIDVVINIGALKSKNSDLILNELKAVRQECSNGIVLKVIIETALLSQEEKITACKLVSEAKADFIKTSTGFSSHGATVEDIKLLKEYIAPGIAIKASGGIKTQEQALAMIDAGATRIGTSNGVNIVSNKIISHSDY